MIVPLMTTHCWYTMLCKSQRLQKACACRKQYYKENKDEETTNEQSSILKEIRRFRNHEAYKARIGRILGSRKKQKLRQAECVRYRANLAQKKMLRKPAYRAKLD